MHGLFDEARQAAFLKLLGHGAIDGGATILLLPLEADQLDHFGPEADGRGEERGLVGVDDGTLPLQIGLQGADEPGALQKLPADEQDGRDDQHGVVGEEGLDTGRGETRVAVEEDDGRHAAESYVAAVWLEPARVGERVAVDALRLARPVEADVRDAHDDVVDDTARGHQVDQPGQDLV